MANWLGKWFGSWFGASAPSHPGAISGAASIRVSASATVTAKGALTGSATITVGASATISSNTVAPQPTVDSVWGQSWGACWGACWGFLVVPYAKLSLKGQVFVRSYLTRIHSVEVAERIVSVAALNNISAVDAEVVVAAKTGEVRLEAIKKRTPSRIQPQEQVKQPERKKPLELTAKYSQPAVFVEQRNMSISAEATQPSLVARHNAMRVDLINYVN